MLLNDQLERVAAVQKLWLNLFPKSSLTDGQALQWALNFSDEIILKGFKRAASKSRRFVMPMEDVYKYATSVMANEVHNVHDFDRIRPVIAWMPLPREKETEPTEEKHGSK